MSLLRLFFAGQIKKVEHKTAAGKALVEVSICKKNRTKENDKETFTWIRATIWEPAEFQVAKLFKDAFIAGSGEMTLRSYADKDGKDRVSCEVSCRSFDVEVSGPQAAPAEAAPAAPSKPRGAKAAPVADDEPSIPF